MTISEIITNVNQLVPRFVTKILIDFYQHLARRFILTGTILFLVVGEFTGRLGLVNWNLFLGHTVKMKNMPYGIFHPTLVINLQYFPDL